MRGACLGNRSVLYGCIGVLVQGYHVVKTPDIPAVAGATELAHRCMASASAILQLLKDTCRSDGASYVLQKDAASETIRLFELHGAARDQNASKGASHAGSPRGHAEQHPQQRDAQAPNTMTGASGAAATGKTISESAGTELHTPSAPAEHAIASAHEQPGGVARPYAARVARLCYHMAVRILDGGPGSTNSTATDSSQAELLLRRCMQLTSASAEPHMYACAALRLATLACERPSDTFGAAASERCRDGSLEHRLRSLSDGAALLKGGLSALESRAPGEHPHLVRSLRCRLFDAQTRTALLHAAGGQPGRAHAYTAEALSWMERSQAGAPKQAQQHRELLRCAGLAYIAMVRALRHGSS